MILKPRHLAAAPRIRKGGVVCSIFNFPGALPDGKFYMGVIILRYLDGSHLEQCFSSGRQESPTMITGQIFVDFQKKWADYGTLVAVDFVFCVVMPNNHDLKVLKTTLTCGYPSLYSPDGKLGN